MHNRYCTAFSSAASTSWTPIFPGTPTVIHLLVQASNAATAVDDDYVVSDIGNSEDLLDDSFDRLPDAPAPPPSEATISAQRLSSNHEAGADVAMQMLLICSKQGGSPTAQDYEVVLRVRASTSACQRFWFSAPFTDTLLAVLADSFSFLLLFFLFLACCRHFVPVFWQICWSCSAGS